jgi:hypothetical protein
MSAEKRWTEKGRQKKEALTSTWSPRLKDGPRYEMNFLGLRFAFCVV